MRKNYIYLSLLLLLSTVMFSQKVTLTPTTVNGANVNTGPINLGFSLSSTVSLNVKVETTISNPDNGTINIYYERSPGWNANIPTGGNGGNLYFGGGKIGIANFVIYLSSLDFNVSGGYIFAEYKSYSGVIYRSPNIAVTKNDNPTPPPPTPNNKSEIVPYGGIPLLPKFTEYDNIASQVWTNIVDQIIDGGSPFYAGTTLREKTTFNDSTIQYGKKVNIFVVNFMPELENLLLDNTITNNQYLTIGQIPQIITGNEPSESHRIKIPGGRDQTVTNSLKNYNIQWQTRIKYPALWSYFGDSFFQLYGWIDIPGATQMSYLPPQTSSGMEYRRLIIENPIDKSDYKRCSTSNVVSIVPILDNPQNTICCDQSLKTTGTTNPLIGTIQNKTTSYQWQISKDAINWSDIFGATNKDFTPSYISSTRPQYETITQYYRRNVFNQSDNQNYISNTVNIKYEEQNASRIIVYPNPTSSNLSLESTIDLTNAEIIINNISGNVFFPLSTIIVNSRLINFNVSNLTTGTYYINIKIGRSTYSATFIKQ